MYIIALHETSLEDLTCKDLLAQQVLDLLQELVRGAKVCNVRLVSLLGDDHQVVHGITIVLVPAKESC